MLIQMGVSPGWTPWGSTVTRRAGRMLVALTLGVGGILGPGVTVIWSQPSPASPSPRGPGAAVEDPSEVALRQRVLAYWQARMRKDYRAQYDLLEPRMQARVSPDEYGRGRTVEYLAAQVERIERRGQFARVAVRLLVRVQHPTLPQGGRTEAAVLPDHWVLVRGQWYRSQDAEEGSEPPWPARSE
jgi:hypothetical protein